MSGGYRSILGFWIGGVSSSTSVPAIIIGGHYAKDHIFHNEKLSNLKKLKKEELRRLLETAFKDITGEEQEEILEITAPYKINEVINYEAIILNANVLNQLLNIYLNLENYKILKKEEEDFIILMSLNGI